MPTFSFLICFNPNSLLIFLGSECVFPPKIFRFYLKDVRLSLLDIEISCCLIIIHIWRFGILASSASGNWSCTATLQKRIPISRIDESSFSRSRSLDSDSRIEKWIFSYLLVINVYFAGLWFIWIMIIFQHHSDQHARRHDKS